MPRDASAGTAAAADVAATDGDLLFALRNVPK